MVGKDMEAATAYDHTRLLSGNLPNGLSFDAETATLSGTPTEIWNNKTVSVTVKNTGGSSTKSMKLNIKGVKPVISTAYLLDGKISNDYSSSLDITGTRTIKTAVTGLPAGLSYSSDTGKITGKPTAYGKFKVSVSAENPAGTSTKSYNMTVKAPPVITTAALTDGTAGKSYKAALTATGTTPITWGVAEGSSLPTGFSLSNKGALKGNPTTYGSYTFTITAKNEAGTVSHDYTLKINAVKPAITTTSLPKGTAGKPYSTTIKVTGTTPLSFDVEGMPEGFTFKDGIMSGTYNYYFNGKVKITASNPAGSDTKELPLLIDIVSPTITTKSLASGTVGTSYTANLTATGTQPITWSWKDSPKGLSLDADTGAITGTPEEAGTFTVKVTASNTDADKSTTKSLKMTIAAAALNVTDYTESYYDDDGENIEFPEMFSGETAGNVYAPADGVSAEERTSGIKDTGGYRIAAVLPEIEITEDGLYDFNVSVDQKAKTGAKLFWFAYHTGSTSDDDNIVEFYDSDGEEIDSVPEDHNLKVSFWMNAGVTYKPVIAVEARNYR